LEGQAFYSSSKANTLPEQKSTFMTYGLDARMNMRPGDGRVVPYLLLGYGAASSKTPPDELTRGAPALGLGVLLSLGNPRSYLRLQVRDTYFKQQGSKEFSQNFALTAGLNWILGGKSKDTDLDGVPEWKDACPNTPIGATVDARGCPSDSDNDGVPDGLDKCPGTASGLKVDKDGCPIEVMEKETELLDTGMIRLQNVNFETNKADILPESLPVLDVVGQVLRSWPELKIEIGGHTDSRGTDRHNQKLSEARAGSVKTYLTNKFPELKPDQYFAKGY